MVDHALTGKIIMLKRSTNMCFDSKLNAVKLTTYVISQFVPEIYIQKPQPNYAQNF